MKAQDGRDETREMDFFFFIVVEMDVESRWRAYLVKKGNK
jgi:hypothetical protein